MIGLGDLVPLALGGLLVLSLSCLSGGVVYWLASRKSRLLVFIGAMVVLGTSVDAVYTLWHSWTGLDSLNRVLNVLAWFSYCVASVVGFAGGVANRESLCNAVNTWG
jgi:hypothetical protein